MQVPNAWPSGPDEDLPWQVRLRNWNGTGGFAQGARAGCPILESFLDSRVGKHDPQPRPSVLKGHGFSRAEACLEGTRFTGCGKAPSGRQEASGHAFSRAGCPILESFLDSRVGKHDPQPRPSVLKGHGFSSAEACLEGARFTGCGKAPSGRQEASGHDFSRADKANRMSRGL